MDFTDLLVDKYAPTTLDDLMLSKGNRKYFESLAKQENKSIPHLLFFGSAGTGKSTLAKIIVRDILQCQYLYINASDQNSIEVVRGQIKNFIETKSIDGKIKVVILDEFDGMAGERDNGTSPQKALRNMIEEYSKYARFIFTANNINKIIDPISSRVEDFYFQPDYNDYLKRCIKILKLEKINLPAEEYDNFKNMVKCTYPDMRKVLNKIQKYSINKEFRFFEVDISAEITAIIDTVVNMLKKNDSLYNVRKHIITNEKTFNSDYHSLLKYLFEYIYNDVTLEASNKKQILLIIADSMYNHQIVMDKEINFTATLLKICGLLL